MNWLRLALIIFTMLSCCTPIQAATITGSVRDANGQPFDGVLVTLFDNNMKFSETVYTDASGTFLLESRQTGETILRLRSPGFADQSLKLNLATRASENLSLTLAPFADINTESDSLPASAHSAKILSQFEDDATRKRFIVHCFSCHGQGTPIQRAPRKESDWRAIVQRMTRDYLNIKNVPLEEKYVAALLAGNDGKPATSVARHSISPEIHKARVLQYPLSGAAVVLPHDAHVHPADGKLYTVDQGSDVVFVTDLETRDTRVIKLPQEGHQAGGKFTTLDLPLTPFITTSFHGPHAIVTGKDERLYMLSAVAGEVTALDPETDELEYFPSGGNALYPHTGRFDVDGILWYTLMYSNQVGRLDPVTGKTILIDLPHTGARAAWEASGLYGLDVNPVDNSIWYSKLFSDFIGRIDPKTLEVQEFQPPLVGPRRMRFSKDGMLWIPAFGDGELVKLDTTTMQYTNYPLPKLSADEIEMPYAVGVHSTTQDIWVTSNTSDRVFRFVRKDERYIIYPMPSRFTYTRDFSFTSNGWACSAESNFPPGITEHGEKVHCIDPGN